MPVSRKSGATVRAAAGLIACGFAGSTAVTPLYALYEAKFGFSAITLTLVYAAYVIGNLGALLFLGRLSDRIGRRPIGLASIALCIIAAILFLGAQGVVWLFAGRIATGLAVGLGSGTGTAWLVDLQAKADRPTATRIAIIANMIGIGGGPLLSGIAATWLPDPLHLVFILYIVAVGIAGVAIWRGRETVECKPVDAAVFRPKIALPATIRAAFVAPAVTGFTIFAFVGFYAALLPSILRDAMHQTSPAAGGAILAELFAVAIIGILATARLSGRAVMLGGLAAIVPALALLVLAETQHSLTFLLLSTTGGGIALALGYRGSLEIVNAIAPADARAGVVSVYLICCFTGNSLPVIGVGVATTAIGAAAASGIFAGIMALLAIGAFLIGLRFAPRGHGQLTRRYTVVPLTCGRSAERISAR